MATEQAFPSSAVEFGGGRVITTPFQFVADTDTFLRVTSVCSVTGVTIAVQGRRRDEGGVLQPIRETHAPNSNRTTKTQDYGLGAGAVLNLTVFASVGAPLKGQCYVIVQLLRNFGGTALVLGTLLAGYVTAVQALGFPGSPIVSSTDGEPAVRNIVGTTPAAGAEVAETVPAGARWELVSVFTLFQASAAVATRYPTIRPTDTGNILGYHFSIANPLAGEAWNLTWSQNHPEDQNDVIHSAASALPSPCYLKAGNAFGTVTVNIQAADQYSLLFYQVREWLEVN